jgi:glucose-6-phosphate dehydrogenase assembly protein OpcA
MDIHEPYISQTVTVLVLFSIAHIQAKVSRKHGLRHWLSSYGPASAYTAIATTIANLVISLLYGSTGEKVGAIILLILLSAITIYLWLRGKSYAQHSPEEGE